MFLDLELINFRNHKFINLNFMSGLNLISGANGSGKTNILEALSLFSLGKGVRSASAKEIANRDGFPIKWEIRASLLDKTNIRISFDGRKKNYFINGKSVSNRDYYPSINIIWCMPVEMYRMLFSSQWRRRFLDRAVFLFFKDHANNLFEYSKLSEERKNILIYNRQDNYLLSDIESKIANKAILIIQNRKSAIELINNASNEVKIESTKDKDISELDVESFRRLLEKNRFKDKELGRSSFGPHLTDLSIRNNKTFFEDASSGEQKLMISLLTIAKAEAFIKKEGKKPIILFDDFSAQFDQKTIEILKKSLQNCACQVIVTDIELEKDFFSVANLDDFIDTRLINA